MSPVGRFGQFSLAAVAVLCSFLSRPASAQDTVRYRLGLKGTYYAPPPCQFPDCFFLTAPAYRHGNESNGQRFNPLRTPAVRWDAICEVEGPNQGAANLVINLELRVGSASGPIATNAVFLGDDEDGDPGPLNFTFGISTQPNRIARIIDPVAAGGPNMGLFTTGIAGPGHLSGAGAGYISWDGRQFHRAGIGRATLPNGKPGLGSPPLFDGKVNISQLANGTYVLVLTPGSGTNVLEDDFDADQPSGHFAKRATNRVGDSISFEVDRSYLSGGTGGSAGGGGTPGDTGGGTTPGDTGGGTTPGDTGSGSTDGGEPTDPDPGQTEPGTGGSNGETPDNGQTVPPDNGGSGTTEPPPPPDGQNTSPDPDTTTSSAGDTGGDQADLSNGAVTPDADSTTQEQNESLKPLCPHCGTGTASAAALSLMAMAFVRTTRRRRL